MTNAALLLSEVRARLPSKAEQLALAHTEVVSCFSHSDVQAACCLDGRLELHSLQDIPQCLVILLVPGIQIASQCAAEQHRVLQAGPTNRYMQISVVATRAPPPAASQLAVH